MIGEIKSILIVKIFQFLNKFQKKEEKKKENISMQKKILIINIQGVGDMVIFTPVIEAIGRKYHASEITMLTSFYGAEVLKNNPFLKEVIVTETINNMSLRKYISFVRMLRKNSYDCVIDTSFTCLSLKQMLLPLAIGARIRIGYTRGGFSHLFPTYQIKWRPEHMIVMYSRIAEVLGANVQLKPKLYSSSKDKKWVIDFLKHMKKPIIIIHPSCQGEEKKWPKENFIKIIQFIQKKHKGTVIITGIPNEKKEIDYIASRAKEKCNVLTNASILQMMELFSKVDLLVSVDTGVVHLAAAANTPIVCIYGPTGQIFWRPYNKNQIILQKKVCAAIGNNPDTEQVIEYINPCPVHGRECVKAISVEEVEEAIDLLL